MNSGVLSDSSMLRGRGTDVAAILVVLAAVWAVFGQTLRFDFISYDDGWMVYNNPRVLGGFTWENLRWAFTHPLVGIWMPLSVLSYLCDAALYGSWAGGYHLSNVFVHGLASVLLYLALRMMTGQPGRALLVALLFAVHPLRAESVAWVAERKDVLCGCFWFLSLCAYAHYARQPGFWRYLAVVCAAACALLSKSMAVTLPCTLLLLDWWPLQRIPDLRGAAWRVLEKVPLFALSLICAWIAFRTQQGAEAVATLDRFPLGLRLENAVVSYGRYALRFFAPADLSIYYPYPEAGHPAWAVALSLGMLLAVSALAILLFRQRHLAVGWLWYLGTALPVIGLVQIGGAAMANRYTYVPGVGIAMLLAWSIPARGRGAKAAFSMAAALAIAALMLLAWRETGYYRNTETLFSRALAVTKDNYLACQKLGELRAGAGRIDEAVALYRRAQALQPNDASCNYYLGCALLQQGQYAEAAACLGRAIQIDPRHAGAHGDLGVALLQLGDVPAALPQLETGIRLDPDNANAHVNYGVGLLRGGRPQDAAREFRSALQLDPANAAARANLDRLPETVR